MRQQHAAEPQTSILSLDPLICQVFGCPPALAERIRSRGRVKHYRPRDHLAKCGDPMSIMVVIASGLAQAILHSASGQPVLLHEYRTGDFFGGLGLSSGDSHDADVVAVTGVASFLLDGQELALLAEQHGCIGLALLQVLMGRLQRSDARMFEHAALTSAGRIHAEILRQARLSEDMTIRPMPVLSDLALRISTTRETVSRAVSALERRGIVRRSADGLVVVAPHRLEELIV